MCRGLPWSTGINRDVPGRDSEILNMFKITGLCRGPPRWSSLPGSAVQTPCWRQDLPCLRRGDTGMYRISISATISFLCRGVPCWLWTWSWTWSRQPSSCQTFLLFFLFVLFSGFSSRLTLQRSSWLWFEIEKVFFNRDPDFAGLYRGLPCWRRGDAGVCRVGTGVYRRGGSRGGGGPGPPPFQKI